MRALIISVDLGDPDFLAHAEEFAMLAKGAGAEIVGTLTARRDRPDAKFFIGSGKADEGVGMAQALLADIVLFDQPLSPAQQRNLERLFNLRVVDRVALILISSRCAPRATKASCRSSWPSCSIWPRA